MRGELSLRGVNPNVARGRRVPAHQREYAAPTSSSRRASALDDGTRRSPGRRAGRGRPARSRDRLLGDGAVGGAAAAQGRRLPLGRRRERGDEAIASSRSSAGMRSSVDPDAPVLEAGRGLERWADPGALSSLELAYAHYDLRDAARALWETVDLFQGLEEETATQAGARGRARRRRAAAADSGCRSRSPARGYRMAVRRLLPMVLVAVASSWPGAAATRRARRPRPRPRRTPCASTSSATGRCGPSVARSRRQAFSSSTTS